MDHFQNPRNVGEIEDASGVGTVGNAKCGDIMLSLIHISCVLAFLFWIFGRSGYSKCNVEV